MKRKAILILLILMGTALSPIFTSAQDVEIILRVAMQDDMKSTNPLVAGDVWTQNVLKFIYEGPIIENPDTDELMPYIAVGTASDPGDIVNWEDCEIGRFDYTDNSTWTSSIGEALVFYDFEGVYWHDGRQMSVRDLMFSYHVAARNQQPDMACLMDYKLVGVDWNTRLEPDPDSLHIEIIWEDGDMAALRFQLQNPYGNFFRGALSPLLFPYHIWGNKIGNQEVDDAKIWCDAGYSPIAADAWRFDLAQYFENPNPVGSGPFRFVDWQRGQLIKISTYRDHFFKNGFKYGDHCLDEDEKTLARLPYIDGIEYKIYKTAESAFLALKNDDIDYIAWPVPPHLLIELAIANGNEYGIFHSLERGFFYLGYNMRCQSFGYNESKSFPYAPEDDLGKPLRRAISHCIDKERIVQRLLLNYGIPGHGPLNYLSPYYNNSIPKYDFNPNRAIEILENASYQLTNPDMPPGSDNHWLNPDGSPIGSGLDGLIEILTPEENYDVIRYNAGIMIASQLQAIGINAESVPMDFGAIVNLLDQRDFDMYLLGWHIGMWETAEYMQYFFHSSNAQSAWNYVGYQNASYDALIDLARETGNEEIKKEAIMEAQAAICYDLPIDVLYYRNNIEVYRPDRFTGWVSEYGTIFNSRSIYNIRPPSPYKVNARFVSPPSALVSNSTGNQITVFVKDQDGNPISGAHVVLNASTGKLADEEGYTTANGKFSTEFTAPWVDPNDPTIAANGTMTFIQIKEATFDSPDGTYYDPAPSRLTMITVYPQDVPFLSVSMSADPDIIDPDVSISGDAITPGFTIIEVEVTDQDGIPVDGAELEIFVSQGNVEVDPNITDTDADGQATIQFYSYGEPNNDDSLVHYYVTVKASIGDDTDFRPGNNSITITVVDRNQTGTPLPPPPDANYWNPLIVAIAGIFAAAVIYAAYRRKSNP